MIIWDLLAYETTACLVAYALVVTRCIWRRRPVVGWDPDHLTYRSARAIYRDRRWR